MRLAALVVLLSFGARPCAAQGAVPAPAPARPATAAAPVYSSLSLAEALQAIDHQELAAVFAYVAEVDAPHALANLLARDRSALKRYVKKISADMAAAGGLSDWDHEVCATLVNMYAGALGAAPERPDAKRLKIVNDCVLSPVMTLQDIASRRKR